jgi:hypothetical protein
MNKKIEIVSASDPQILQQQLEQMVNVGWIIKGVVGYNPHDVNSEPFVILERESINDPSINESYYENEKSVTEQYYSKPEPPRKEISISMGN